MKRSMRVMGGAAATVALLMTVAATPAGAAPGDQSLVNFVHIYNKTSPGAAADGQGTDIEFYTTTVPRRDYTTGEFLGEDGLPLDPEEPQFLWTRDYAIMGSYGGGAYVYDITDPEAIQFTIRIPCNQTQNDVQIKQFGDTWVLALSRDGTGNPCANPQKGTSGQAGIAVFDVTDPFAFAPMYSFRTNGGAHNFTFHPTKPFGWVSTGDLPGGNNHIPIINFTDLANPVLAADPAIVGGPHDISFSPDGTRAYVAAENNYRIYNTENPGAPVEISVTPNNGTYAHGFDPTPNKQIAVGTNESLALGGFFAGGSTVCPGEGLTFYNLTTIGESRPVPVGEYLPTDIVGRGPDNRACTGHVGKMAANNHVLTTGWYIGGARVVDFANPSQPVEVGRAVMTGAEVWSAKFYKGPYMYTADQRRGFDAFRWTGTGPAPWLAP